MKLPNWERAYIPSEKLHNYLLSETHPVGRLKARFLNSVGFDSNNIEALEQGLLEIAHTQEIAQEIPGGFGVKYVLSGSIQTPTHNILQLTTVWIIETEQENPRFITAYPQ